MTTLEKIRAEIAKIEPLDYPCDKREPEHIRDMALDIIDKYNPKEEEWHKAIVEAFELCEDAVSRQAVLEIIDKWYENNSQLLLNDCIEDLIVYVTYMPPVRPQEQAGHMNGTPIPDNATNGDVIKVVFGDDKVSAFMGYVRIMEKVGNWFNDGVVAEFDKDWWNAKYKAESEDKE